MASSSEIGIDTSLFKTKLPEMLLCRLCHLVPRYPMKVATCAHIFCKSCFHPYRTSAIKDNQTLTCPVDQKKIEYHNVAYDEETELFIGNQGVYCPNKHRECQWEGTFNSMEEHLQICKKKDNMNEFLERLTKVEEKLIEKDREINYLKNNNVVQVSYDLRNKVRKQKEKNEELELKVYELTRKNEDDSAAQEAVNDELKEKVKSVEIQIDEMKTKEEKTNEGSSLLKSAGVVTGLVIKKPSQIYFNITIDNTEIGQIIIQLYHDLAPKTCQKLCQLVTNSNPGRGYKDAKVESVTPQYFTIGAVLITEANTRGESFNEFKTPQENSKAKHNKKGLVSMPTYGNGETWTRFDIYTRQHSYFDGCATIAGHVTDESWYVAEKIWGVPLNRQKSLKITECGVIN